MDYTKPNNLFIAVDDLRPELGCYGHDQVLSPNIDRLANEGIVFERAYCTTGICTPSRSSLMSGLYSRTLGLLSNGEKTKVMNEVISLAIVFKQNNYNCYETIYEI